MRYLILLILSCTLIFSCGSESKTAPTKNEATVVKAKKANITKANAYKAKYWAHMKKNAGLSDTQVANVKKIKRKYNAQTQALKKNKKWAGKKNAAYRKKVFNNTTADIKKTLGESTFVKWTATNKEWRIMNKKKK